MVINQNLKIAPPTDGLNQVSLKIFNVLKKELLSENFFAARGLRKLWTNSVGEAYNRSRGLLELHSELLALSVHQWKSIFVGLHLNRTAG